MAYFLGTAKQRAAKRSAARARGIRAGRIRPTRGDIGRGAAPEVRAAVAEVIASQSQRQAKTDALNSINRIIRDASGIERARLISERDKISAVAAEKFSASQIASVRETIAKEQLQATFVKEREQKIAEAQQRGEITRIEAQRLSADLEMARRDVRTISSRMRAAGAIPHPAEKRKAEVLFTPKAYERVKELFPSGVIKEEEKVMLERPMSLETIGIPYKLKPRVTPSPQETKPEPTLRQPTPLEIIGIPTKPELRLKEPSGLEFSPFWSKEKPLSLVDIGYISKIKEERAMREGLITGTTFTAPIKYQQFIFGAEERARRMQREERFVTAFGIQAGIFGIEFVKSYPAGAVALVNPQFYKDVFYQVTEPEKAFAGLGQELRRRTAATLGGLIGFGKGFGWTTRKITVPFTTTKMAAISEYKPKRPKGWKEKRLFPEKLPIEKIEGAFEKAAESSRVAKAKQVGLERGRMIDKGFAKIPRISKAEMEKPIFSKPSPLKIRMEPTLTGEQAMQSFKKMQLGETQFPKVSKTFAQPRGAFARLKKRIVPAQRQQLILLEEEVAVQTKIPKQIQPPKMEPPKMELRFPSIARLRTVQAARVGMIPLRLAGISKPRLISKTITEQKLEPLLKAETMAKLEPLVKLEAITKLEPLLKAETMAKLEPLVKLEAITVPMPKVPPIKAVRFRFDLAAKPKPAYDVFVREGEKKQDKFIKIASGLPRNRALNRGARIVDETTAATFRIKPIKKQTQKIDDPFFELVAKFRKPKGRTKLPSGSFVERNKHRIDTMGELMGIPFKAKAMREQRPMGVF